MSFKRKLIIGVLRVVRVTFALLAMLSMVEADPVTAFAATWYGAMLISAAISAASYGIEYLLTPRPKAGTVDRGRNDDIRFAFSGYGEGIPIVYGEMRLAPLWFWYKPIVHTTTVTPGPSGGGKGLPHPAAPTTTQHIYTCSLAGLLCEGELVNGVRKIWIGTDLVFNLDANGASRYEAEAGGNTLAGGASVTACASCSGGNKVTGIGSGGSIQFNGVTGTSPGDSQLAIFYTSTTELTLKMSINGDPTTDVVCPASGGSGIVAIVSVFVPLNTGANTIHFSNAGAACPDIDKIEVAPPIIIEPGGDCALGWHADPDTGRCVPDHVFVTGAINENIVPALNQDIAWPYYNYAPTASSGVYTFNLAKYGQPSIRIYTGTETQVADSAIIADKGADHAPAYRGIAYIVFEDLQLPDGNTSIINAITVEVDQGTTTASGIATDVYRRVGVDSSLLNVSAITGDTLTGFIIPTRQQAAKAITDLQTCFQFDMPEVDGKVKAVNREGASAATVNYTDMRAHEYGSEMPAYDMLVSDADELTLPARVDVQYLDPANDYHQNTQSDMALTGNAWEQVSVSLPVAMSADQAKKLAITLRVKPWLEGRTFTWTEGPKSYKYHPGDVKTFTLQSGASHTVRITSQKLTLPIGVAEYEGVRQAASLYSPTSTGSTGTGFEAPQAGHPANTKGVFIDSPLLRPEDAGDGSSPVVYIAACVRAAGLGNASSLYIEEPIESNVYQLVTNFQQQSGIGETVGTLANVTDPTAWDRTSTLEINFISLVELSSATEADLLATPGLNLLWIGVDGIGEYVQFKNAVAGTATAPYVTNYTIDTFLRGRFLTDVEIGNHTATDDVVVIDSTIHPRRMSSADIGRERNYKFLTAGQAAVDAVTTTFTLRGNSLLPPAPSDAKVFRDAQNNALWQWRRRGRINNTWRDRAGVPVTEEQQLYEIEVLLAGNVVKTYRVDASSAQPISWATGGINTSGITFATDGSGTVSAVANITLTSISHGVLFSNQQIDGEFVLEFETYGPGYNIPYFVMLEPTNEGGVNLGYWDRTTPLAFEAQPESMGGSYVVAAAPGDRFAIEYQSGVLSYYKNPTGANSPPIFRTTTPQLYAPYRVRCHLSYSANEGIKNPSLLRLNTADWTYTAGMQTLDGLTPGDPIHLRIYQVSAVAGRGQVLDVTL